MENHSTVIGWEEFIFPYKHFNISAAIAIAIFEIRGWKFAA